MLNINYRTCFLASTGHFHLIRAWIWREYEPEVFSQPLHWSIASTDVATFIWKNPVESDRTIDIISSWHCRNTRMCSLTNLIDMSFESTLRLHWKFNATSTDLLARFDKSTPKTFVLRVRIFQCSMTMSILGPRCTNGKTNEIQARDWTHCASTDTTNQKAT